MPSAGHVYDVDGGFWEDQFGAFPGGLYNNGVNYTVPASMTIGYSGDAGYGYAISGHMVNTDWQDEINAGYVRGLDVNTNQALWNGSPLTGALNIWPGNEFATPDADLFVPMVGSAQMAWSYDNGYYAPVGASPIGETGVLAAWQDVRSWGGNELEPAQTGNSGAYDLSGNVPAMIAIQADYNGYGTQFVNDNNFGRVVGNSIVNLAGTSLTNQDNAPGAMPNSTLSGFGAPIDSATISNSLAGDQGLAVAAAMYTGTGIPLTDISWPNSTISIPTSGLTFVTDYTGSGVINVQGGYWGDGTAAMQTSSMTTFDNGSGGIYTVTPSSPLPTGLYTADNYALNTIAWGGDGTQSLPVSAELRYNDNGSDLPVGKDTPFPVTSRSTGFSNTDTYTSAVTGTAQNFNVQNYTWQTRCDDPTSVGLAYTIVLENSIDGGATWEILDTKTQADVNSPKTTISAHPGSKFVTYCSSLSLGLTATQVTASVLAQ